ncbi:hypothetical protein FJT64_015688 [Amphibalanus amphitrite]|uniref:PID domain-containing protein n=1 Tax=Amphibalanus amphitrite TaxID=1232801 RepID=A0A6A4XGG4_AMPAM|nr:uncharacterized protein LOC122369418 [Amphibalanus amphitrite]KAF0313802.1 hypothetical protein FJT64_015688 [Amphibalanus amphitrite]
MLTSRPVSDGYSFRLDADSSSTYSDSSSSVYKQRIDSLFRPAAAAAAAAATTSSSHSDYEPVEAPPERKQPPPPPPPPRVVPARPTTTTLWSPPGGGGGPGGQTGGPVGQTGGPRGQAGGPGGQAGALVPVSSSAPLWTRPVVTPGPTEAAVGRPSHGTEFAVEYLGAVQVADNATRLEQLQQPLKRLYVPRLRRRRAAQLSDSLSISDTGLRVRYGRDQELLNPFTTVAVWAAVKFVASRGGGGGRLRFGFLPLICDPESPERGRLLDDDEGSLPADAPAARHPPLLACVMRRPGTLGALECHGFVCAAAEDAIVIAANLYQALLMRMQPEAGSGGRRQPRPADAPILVSGSGGSGSEDALGPARRQRRRRAPPPPPGPPSRQDAVRRSDRRSNRGASLGEQIDPERPHSSSRSRSRDHSRDHSRESGLSRDQSRDHSRDQSRESGLSRDSSRDSLRRHGELSRDRSRESVRRREFQRSSSRESVRRKEFQRSSSRDSVRRKEFQRSSSRESMRRREELSPDNSRESMHPKQFYRGSSSRGSSRGRGFERDPSRESVRSRARDAAPSDGSLRRRTGSVGAVPALVAAAAEAARQREPAAGGGRRLARSSSDPSRSALQVVSSSADRRPPPAAPDPAVDLGQLLAHLQQRDGIRTVDDVLRRVIAPGGMSFSELRPEHRELLLRLALTLSKDEMYQRSKSIMKKQTRKGALFSSESETSTSDGSSTISNVLKATKKSLSRFGWRTGGFQSPSAYLKQHTPFGKLYNARGNAKQKETAAKSLADEFPAKISGSVSADSEPAPDRSRRRTQRRSPARCGCDRDADRFDSPRGGGERRPSRSLIELPLTCDADSCSGSDRCYCSLQRGASADEADRERAERRRSAADLLSERARRQQPRGASTGESSGGSSGGRGHRRRGGRATSLSRAGSTDTGIGSAADDGGGGGGRFLVVSAADEAGRVFHRGGSQRRREQDVLTLKKSTEIAATFSGLRLSQTTNLLSSGGSGSGSDSEPEPAGRRLRHGYSDQDIEDSLGYLP